MSRGVSHISSTLAIMYHFVGFGGRYCGLVLSVPVFGLGGLGLSTSHAMVTMLLSLGKTLSSLSACLGPGV